MPRLFRRAARKLLKLPHRLYYRYLFGHSSPLARRLAPWVARYERDAGMGDVPLSREAWDEQYRAGGWDFLGRLEETPRYSLIVGYLAHLRPGGSVLDVGCGEGLLSDLLRPHGYRLYHGVDLSEEAVARAAERTDERTRFTAADARTLDPGGPWDAIVFNECLYYFDDPLAVFDRSLDHLAAGGVAIVSLYGSPRTRAILRRLAQVYPRLEEATVENRRGTWTVAVFRPGDGGEG